MHRDASLTRPTIRNVSRHAMNCDWTSPAGYVTLGTSAGGECLQTPLSHRRTAAADHSSEGKRRGSVRG